MDKLSLMSPGCIKRLKVDKKDEYSKISKWWYFVPLQDGMALNRPFLPDNLALVNRPLPPPAPPLVVMQNHLFNQIEEVSEHPGNEYIRCSIIFIQNGLEEIEQLLQ